MPTVDPVLERVGRGLFRGILPNFSRSEKRHSACNEEWNIYKPSLASLVLALFYHVSGETLQKLGISSQLCGIAPWDTFVLTQWQMYVRNWVQWHLMQRLWAWAAGLQTSYPSLVAVILSNWVLPVKFFLAIYLLHPCPFYNLTSTWSS